MQTSHWIYDRFQELLCYKNVLNFADNQVGFGFQPVQIILLSGNKAIVQWS